MMSIHIPERPKFSDKQLTAAGVASKTFGKIRSAAKDSPQYILANNKLDSVVLDYAYYLKMYQELEVYRELFYLTEIARRAEYADAHPEETVSLREAVGEANYAQIMSIDPDEISDDELFE